MVIWIGHDSREQAAFDVASKTASRFGYQTKPLYADRLRMSGMLTRPIDSRYGLYDFNSFSSQSTEFAVSRFFVPLLTHSGWALFVDVDVVFLRDPAGLLKLADDSKAVMVVKHPPLTMGGTKMDGQEQKLYARKNWSSVVFWNCDHPANKRINLSMLNQWPAANLHAFGWLADSEIGELPEEWNWLVNVRPKPANPAIAHFTEGGPWLPGWTPREHDDIWLKAAA